jgi:phosphoserine phosphatase RsbU/P
VMYTDGVSEARNRDGNIYGVERIQEVLATETSTQSLVRSLLTDLERFTEHKKQEDDICVVAFSRNREETTMSP